MESGVPAHNTTLHIKRSWRQKNYTYLTPQGSHMAPIGQGEQEMRVNCQS